MANEMIVTRNELREPGTVRHLEHVIEAVKPDFYLKGSEYSAEEDDVTGRIKTERLMVEKFGGAVLYTEDITFSSSNLSNRVLQLYPEDAAAFLKDLRTRITAADLIPVLFHRTLDGHQLGFAMGEAIAHLNHLVVLGRMERVCDPAGVVRYRPQ